MNKTLFLIALSLGICSCWSPHLYGSGTRAETREKTTPAELRLKWYKQHLDLKETSIFKYLNWRSIGPSEGSGRITDIAVPKGKPYTIYVSSASGGVWKTVNNGTTWDPIWDHAASNAVGDIAVSESNPNIVWVGAGENNCRRWSYSGTGVYKSTDAGRTWQHMGLSDAHTTGRIVIDPENPDIVFVAAMGHMYTRNEMRGVFKTTDGGKTWEKVLFINDNAGSIDLIMDPSNRNIIYASTWERVRKPWKIIEHGAGSGIYKSTDSGETWKKLENGLPTGEFIGRIGLNISRSNPNIIYALIDNHNDMTDKRALKKAERYENTLKLIIGAEVYRSDDKGEHWRKANTDDISDLNYVHYNMGYYWGEIRVSPDNEDEIYIMGSPLFKSFDGGKTFERISYPILYSDHQAMWIDPDNPDHIIDGNDHGLYFTYDRGKTWEHIKMPIGQFYSVAVDMDEPFNVYGSLQDNFCWYGAVTNVQGITEQWEKFPGGERSHIAFDYTDYNTVYTSAGLNRTDTRTWESQSISPRNMGEKLRQTWYPPIILSPHNPQIIYYGTQKLLMSLDRGENWQFISPDLSTDNPQRRGTPFVHYGAITMISESPHKFGLIYVGTDDGNVQVTKNGGTTWEKIMDGLPRDRWVSRIIASEYDESTVYVTLSGLRNDDFTAYVYKSTDYGKTWKDISHNLPGGPVNVIREDPKNENILYTGTDLGIYASLNQGESWISLCSNLPTTFVHDLVVHPRDDVLVLGTHGRSVYVMDVGPIQEYDQKISGKDFHMFGIPTVYRTQQRGANQKAQIYYYLNESRPVTVEIIDETQKVVKSLGFQGNKGINVTTWDLTRETGNRRENNAPPGNYTVNMKAGNEMVSGILKIVSP